MSGIKVRYMENLPSAGYKTRQFEVELSQNVKDGATINDVDDATRALFEQARRNVQQQIQLSINSMTFPQ